MIELSEEQRMILNTVKNIAQDKIKPRAAEIDEKEDFPWDAVSLFAENGVLTPLLPEKYGGIEAEYLLFSMILEAVPAPLGKLVAKSVRAPVIGIGAGPDVDGQVLVTHDMIGLFDKFIPKFVKQYTQIRPTILDALNRFKEDVRGVTFPGPEHSFKMPDEALEQLKKLIKD